MNTFIQITTSLLGLCIKVLHRVWQWFVKHVISFIKKISQTTVWLKVKIFFILLWRFIVNLWVTFIYFKSTNRAFTGWLHYWIAKKYCDKRTKHSNVQKALGGGKRHHVLPWGKETLVVLNRIEINALKARGDIKKSVNIIWLIEHAYYTSK